MARFGFAVNVERCTGCYNCFLACKDEFVGNDYLPTAAAQPDAGPGWMRVDETEYGQGDKVKVDYVPTPCQNCQDAPCLKVGGDALYRRADGIIIIDPVKAKGRKEIVASCPYGAIGWNEEKSLAQKCTMCAHMLDNGEKVTRCSESCPTQALYFGDLDDPKSAIAQLLVEKAGTLEVLHPEFGIKPAMQYIALPKPFLCGEVVLADKTGECPRGVKLTLTAKADGQLFSAETDFFGDFEFKGLAANAEYVVRAEFPGYEAKEIVVKTDVSHNLGVMALARK